MSWQLVKTDDSTYALTNPRPFFDAAWRRRPARGSNVNEFTVLGDGKARAVPVRVTFTIKASSRAEAITNLTAFEAAAVLTKRIELTNPGVGLYRNLGAYRGASLRQVGAWSYDVTAEWWPYRQENWVYGATLVDEDGAPLEDGLSEVIYG